MTRKKVTKKEKKQRKNKVTHDHLGIDREYQEQMAAQEKRIRYQFENVL